jgi:hypothetical protein
MVSNMVSMCLMPFHLLCSRHYYEPSSPQQPPLVFRLGRDQDTLIVVSDLAIHRGSDLDHQGHNYVVSDHDFISVGKHKAISVPKVLRVLTSFTLCCLCHVKAGC